MNVIALFLISSVLTISCYAECIQSNAPSSPPASAGFFLYKNDEYISNKSTIYHCDHCETQCSTGCEEVSSQCGGTSLWCIRGVPKNSSKEESMNVHKFSIDGNVSVEWIEPTPSQANPQYLSSSANNHLCLCRISDVAQCNSSSEEGVYKCIVKGNNVTETLQFTYSIYKVSSTNSTPVIMTSSFYKKPVEVSATTSLSTKTTTETTTIPTTTTETTTATTTTTTASSPHYTSSVTSLSSSSLTPCSSSVKDQVSTTPHYAGIGLLLTTNLLTLIVLVTSCAYIIRAKKQTKYVLGRSKANVTVQSNPIGSMSVINIETEILNEEYDTCQREQQQQQQQPPRQQQQQQQEQQQQEPSRPQIDIYSYAGDEEDYDHLNDDSNNDEYAVPDDVWEIKRKGNSPPTAPPPYAGRGIEVEERVNGVSNSNSFHNTDYLYATIGSSNDDEKEQSS